MAIRVGGLSDTGRLRLRNEDAIAWDEHAQIAVLADGLGGHPAGDVASRITVEAVVERAAQSGALDLQDHLCSLVESANTAVLAHAEANPAYRGMASTIVVVGVEDDRVGVVHCGDSRAYRWHSQFLLCLTRDHNVAQEAVEHRLLTVDEARQAPQRHILTQALGLYEQVQCDYTEWPRKPGDLYLLCSDGITDELEDPEIAQVLATHAHDPSAAAQALVQAAIAAGGHDNASAVVVSV